jgi:hypothetical protein
VPYGAGDWVCRGVLHVRGHGMVWYGMDGYE